MDGGRDARNLPFWQPGGRSSLPGSMDDSTERPDEVEATKDEEGRGVRILVGVIGRRTSNGRGLTLVRGPPVKSHKTQSVPPNSPSEAGNARRTLNL